MENRSAVSRAPCSSCLRCEHEEFRLYSTGTIHCAKCGALIRNINVAPKESGAS